MGISFGVRLLLALLLRPILLFADNNYCHAIVDASITLPLPRTKATANDVSDTVAVRRGGRLDRALAGGTSRALAQAALYPLDALRTLAQTRDGRTLADVGAWTLLNGCFQTSTVALLTGAAQFGLRGLFEPHFGPLASSALGAAGSCVFSVPQEVVKQRLVTGVYGSFRYAVSEIWRTEGAAGFYAGWRPTMSRNVPFVVATFASRDALQGAIAGYRRRRTGRDDVGDVTKTAVAEDVVVGIASALVACALTQPMDVVKTRMMTQAASMAVPYASALDCATSILRTEGWGRLYSGVGQRAVYMGGMWGVTFGLEPVLTKYLAEREARRHYLAASIEAPGPERKWGKVVAPRDCCRGRTSTTATATSRRRRIRSRRRRRRRRRP